MNLVFLKACAQFQLGMHDVAIVELNGLDFSELDLTKTILAHYFKGIYKIHLNRITTLLNQF